MKEYRASPEGKAKMKEYYTSPKVKAKRIEYNKKPEAITTKIHDLYEKILENNRDSSCNL